MRLRTFLTVSLFIAMLAGCDSGREATYVTGQSEQGFATTVTRTLELKYLLYLPAAYGADDRAWPVMLFLHGAGERGDDIEQVKTHGPPKLVEGDPDFPFILISPQCPRNHWWSDETMQQSLAALLDDVCRRYAVDEGRLYVTGLSMGGYGTWSLAARQPDRFAAIAPICGGGDPQAAAGFAQVPAWVFHGAKDNVVPLERSEEMVQALRDAGAEVRFTVYPDADHDSWTETYANPELYEWLLSHDRGAGR